MLTVCLITKNEEKNVRECLRSVKDIADEIVVLDSHSTDRTLEIAQEFNVKARLAPFQDFSQARNAAASHATQDWILHMDADQRMDPPSAEKIKKLLPSSSESHYEILDYVHLPNGGWNVPSVTKLVRNNKDIFWKKAVDETLNPSVSQFLGENYKRNPTDIIFHHLRNDQRNVTATAHWYMEILRRELEKNPNDSYYLRNMGRQFADIGDFAEAVRLCSRAIEIHPQRTRYYTYLGLFHYGAGDYRQAISAFENSLSKDPNDHNAMAMLAKIEYKLDLEREALEKWATIHRQNKNLVHPLVNTGIHYQKRGDMEAALTWFEKAYEGLPYLIKVPVIQDRSIPEYYFCETLGNYEGLGVHLIRAAERSGRKGRIEGIFGQVQKGEPNHELYRFLIGGN